MKTRDLAYSDQGVSLNGYLAYDESVSGKRPAILVVHEAFGLGTHAIERAERLAGLGYVAFAVDMFGDRKQAADLQGAMALMGELYNDGARLRARIGAAYRILLAEPDVDHGRIGAIGFCFGGMTVLELARSGAELAGVVSFHGALAARAPINGKIKAKILVCHGGDDPMVGNDQVVAFQEEMRAAGADWQLNIYGGAVHSFTNEGAANAGMPGIAYHRPTDLRSWAAMRYFFDEAFGAR